MSKMMKKGFNIFMKMKNRKEKDEEIEGRASKVIHKNGNESNIENQEKKEERLKNAGKLFVGGLSQLTTTKSLETYFSLFGKLTDVVVPKSRENGKSMGYGIVTFSNPEDAEAALQTEIHTLDGKLIDVRQFESKSVNREGKHFRVFLGGLPNSIREEDLRQAFSIYGEVVDVVILRDKLTKKSKGFGFLAFKDENAFEKCIANEYFFLNGRRVQVKKAEPRDRRSESGTLSFCSNPDVNIDEAFEASENEDTEDTTSTASGKELLAIEQNPALEKLFFNYFIKKLASFDIMNDKNFNKVTETFTHQGEEVAEMEKLLADFLSFSSNCTGSSDRDLIEFSDDKETESEEGESESSDAEVTSQPCNISCDIKTSGVLVKKLTDKENPQSKASVSNESDSLQKSMPLQIKHEDGFLLCSVCQWISPNDSSENFLAHCKTSIHKAKLKERFPSEQTNKQPLKDDSKLKVVSDKPLAKVAKKQNKNKRASNKEPTNATDAKKDPMRLRDPTKNLSIQTLAKGMTSILPCSENQFICTLCNKKIPKALDLNILMKNLSSHLQSKTHMKNLSDIENSSKVQGCSSCSAKSNFASCGGKEIPKPRNPRPQGKNLKKDQEGNLSKKNKNSTVDKPPDVPKERNSTFVNKPQKGKPVKEKQKTGSNTKFLCLPCNVMSQDTESFNIHLSLKSHSESLCSKNVKADTSLANMSKCKGCEIYLFGSLYLINKHYSKCSGKKN